MTHALLGSYAVQSLFGDYDSREHGVGVQYFAHVNFAPQQSNELLEQIAEMHRAHRSLYISSSSIFSRIHILRCFSSELKNATFFIFFCVVA